MNAAFVWLPGIDDGLLQDMFQKRLMRRADRIELVDVDQGKTIQQQFRFTFIAEINTVGIIFP